ELMPRPGVQKIGDFEPGDAAGPGEKAALTIELRVFLPQDERRLLNDVIRVVQIADQRMNVAKQARLAALQLSGKIGVEGKQLFQGGARNMRQTGAARRVPYLLVASVRFVIQDLPPRGTFIGPVYTTRQAGAAGKD